MPGFPPRPRPSPNPVVPLPPHYLNCCRQWGKSTVISALLAHHLVFASPGALAVAISRTARQTAELLLKVRGFFHRLGLPMRRDGANPPSLVLPHGPRLVGLPPTDATIRGYSAVSWLVLDEAAFLRDAVYHAARPMTATTDAALYVLSTPNRRRGFFWDIWSQGGPAWQRFQVKAPDCARIPRRHLDEERYALGEHRFRQDYLCEFLQDSDTVFKEEWLQRALTDKYKALK